MLEPEQAWPSMNLTPSATMRLATETACFGIALVVLDVELDLAAVDAARRVDRVGGGLRALLELIADGGELSGHRSDHRKGDVVGEGDRRAHHQAENGRAQNTHFFHGDRTPPLSRGRPGRASSREAGQFHPSLGLSRRIGGARLGLQDVNRNAKSRASLVPAGRGFCLSSCSPAPPRPKTRSPSLSRRAAWPIPACRVLGLVRGGRPSCAALFLPVRPSCAALIPELSPSSRSGDPSELSASSSIRGLRAAPWRSRPSTWRPTVPSAVPRRGPSP